MDRTQLPFRRVTEGYFICDDGLIFARDSGKGYLELPGGGVDDGEDIEQGLLREAYEEAGVIVDGELVLLKNLTTFWAPTWGVTEKQRRRYQQFQGEKISFFSGKVKRFEEPIGDIRTGEPGWTEPRRMSVREALAVVEAAIPFPESVAEYRETQRTILKGLLV